VLTNLSDAVHVDINSFEGTFDTLPEGIGISRDGRSLLQAQNANDFLGISTGCVVSGGCYAWDLDGTNRAVGCQPTTDDFTPGFFELSMSNASPACIRGVTLSYDVVYRNNGNRSSVVKLEAGVEGQPYIKADAVEVITPVEQAANAVWEKVSKSIAVSFPASCLPGGRLCIRWRCDDVSGSGYRDELGISNVRLQFMPNKGTVLAVR
jgi:hypothetical protein